MPWAAGVPAFASSAGTSTAPLLRTNACCPVFLHDFLCVVFVRKFDRSQIDVHILYVEKVAAGVNFGLYFFLSQWCPCSITNYSDCYLKLCVPTPELTRAVQHNVHVHARVALQQLQVVCKVALRGHALTLIHYLAGRVAHRSAPVTKPHVIMHFTHKAIGCYSVLQTETTPA